jgi:multidrug efflux pump subunit AcrB
MLTPMMASKYMKPYHEAEAQGRVKTWYLNSVDWCLTHRWKTLAAVTAVMCVTLFLAGILPKNLRPPADNGFFNINVNLPPGSRLQDTRDVVDQVRERLKGRPEITRIWAVVNVRSANIGIVLVDRKKRTQSQQQLQRQYLAQVRGIAGARFASGGNNFGSGALQVEITGDDSNLLSTAASQIERELRAVPGFSNVSTSASLLQPELVIRPRPERAAELGVTTSAISQATRIATSGDVTNNLAKMNLPDRQIPIRVRLNDEARASLDQIRLLTVPSRTGPIPLVNVADVYFGAGPAQITRYNRSRNITISADRGVIPLGQAIQIARNLPTMKNLPSGVHPVESGEAELQSRIFGGFALAMLTGIFCIYALLVLLFHDVLQPITILSALPPSAGGAFVMLWLLHMDLSLPSLIGLLMLMGIVTKNSILLVEYAVMARRERGMSRAEALIDACSKRARPIVMTTIAMAAGMLPITLGFSGDSSFRAPMGAAVIGGLFASTALSLFVVPVIYTLMDDFEHRVKRLFGRLRPGRAARASSVNAAQ